MTAEQSAHLLQQYRSGDEAAARELFDLYVVRLVDLADSRLTHRIRRKVDPEDVVQSAYRSFFRGAKDGRFDVRNGGDLWRLLAAITIRKVLKKVERFRAAKRSLDREESVDLRESLGVAPEQAARDPSPEEAAILNEQLALMFTELLPLHQQMLVMRLEGKSIEEISKQTERTEHQVRRVLKKAKNRLEEILLA